MPTATKTKNQTPAAIQPMCGADILVESMVRHGSDIMFAYPGGASMPIHQALTKYKNQIRTILPRHEQGCGFGAIGYARATGKVGLCMATSGPGATNIVTCMADAKMDSVPVVCVTGQVATPMIGTDAFQETPITDICKLITKHHYLVTDVNDIARIVKEAYFIAATGRPGPVLIDVPKDIQQAMCVPKWDEPMHLRGYRPQTRKARSEQVEAVAEAIKAAKKPLLYVGGGIITGDAAAELRAVQQKTGIPAVETLMGLGALDGNDALCLNMLGMHGSAYANYAIHDCDLLLAFGVRFDDRVTGKVSEFVKHATIVHVDVDNSELNKNKIAHISIESDIKSFLTALLPRVERCQIEPWLAKVEEWRRENPYKVREDAQGAIYPQYAMQQLSKLVNGGNAVVSVGVGQHQMFAAQHYRVTEPRTFLSSSGLGTMGYGLPTAMGVAAALPEKYSIEVDGDGSFQMNIQELATLVCERLPVKVIILNNQHLGMVMQWEDRFHEGNRAHTYLGPSDDPRAEGKGDGTHQMIYPDFVKIAEGYGIKSRRIEKKEEVAEALKEMLAHDGPYLLDVITPYQEHVLPMIPGGKTIHDMITE